MGLNIVPLIPELRLSPLRRHLLIFCIPLAVRSQLSIVFCVRCFFARTCGNLRLSPTDPHNLRIVVAFVPSLLVGFVKAFDDCDFAVTVGAMLHQSNMFRFFRPRIWYVARRLQDNHAISCETQLLELVSLNSVGHPVL